ncbi:hypothetical protein E4U13_004865 [Claviceps humidiphila]|uniref:Uncharacterized protein n=1 Tax=Claviceps humidiphila TaxID=1294629 RepID=A0A9P7Q7C8_9HYPO|nr:hypothetical protein E4U13_004865 [Claviceps humidiphila]
MNSEPGYLIHCYLSQVSVGTAIIQGTSRSRCAAPTDVARSTAPRHTAPDGQSAETERERDRLQEQRMRDLFDFMRQS